MVCRYATCLAVCIGLLRWGISTLKGMVATSTMLSWGLGAVTGRTVMYTQLPLRGANALLGNSVLANTPQLVLSLLYFAYNGLFTSICLATEWSGFAVARKGLRVSAKPVGDQRKSYFLQLPYRFAIPLILVSILLHWLVAQSLFLVSVEFYSTGGGASLPPALVAHKSITSCGWSPVAIVCVIIAGTLLTAVLVGVGAMRLPSGMPVAGSCSLAMAAACHPIPYEEESWTKRVIWGATGGDPPHCSFTNRPDVEYPSTQLVYS